uniref:Uncharacterized protein n=1 Tax=Apteryx owenii TaxID=8824 RepID=A0A8B9Q611_APTOW
WKSYLNPFLTSDNSKKYKQCFSVPSHTCRMILCFPPPFPKEMWQKCSAPSMPVQKDEGVQVVQGHYKGQQVSKIVQVAKTAMCTACIQRVHPCKTGITRMKADRRSARIKKKKKKAISRYLGKSKNKISIYIYIYICIYMLSS